MTSLAMRIFRHCTHAYFTITGSLWMCVCVCVCGTVASECHIVVLCMHIAYKAS